MLDREADELIDRIIAGARIASRSRRHDLRRELEAHFEDAVLSGGTLVDAVKRFGPENVITRSFRHVYRPAFVFLYATKVGTSVLACAFAAFAIQFLTNLRIRFHSEGFALAPEFSRAALASIGVVFGLVIVWELKQIASRRVRAAAAVGAGLSICLVASLLFSIPPGALLTPAILVGLGSACSKLELRVARLPLIFFAFSSGLYATHLLMSVRFEVARAIPAGAVQLAVWISALWILAYVDGAFHRYFDVRRT